MPARSFVALAAAFRPASNSTIRSAWRRSRRSMEAPVGSVLALEAACMTENGKPLLRAFSSHLTVYGANAAIAAAFFMVNAAQTFVSPDRNKFDLTMQPAVVNVHRQPAATLKVLDKINEPRLRTRPGSEGVDAIGVTVVDCRNDGTPVEVLTRPPAVG